MISVPYSHQTCPFCHTPVALARYEFASDGQHTWRICPECDHTLLIAEALALGLSPTAASNGAGLVTATEPLHA